MRRVVEIFLAFTRTTRHQHPHLRAVVLNYASLLFDMELSLPDVQKTIAALGPESLANLTQELNKPRPS